MVGTTHPTPLRAVSVPTIAVLLAVVVATAAPPPALSFSFVPPTATRRRCRISAASTAAAPSSAAEPGANAAGAGDNPSSSTDRMIVDVTPDPPRHPTPLSLTVDELGSVLGGKGRAQAAWDCLKIGVDPLLYYDPSYDESLLDASVSECVRGLLSTTREQVAEHLPPRRRRTEGMGRPALRELARVMGRSSSSSAAVAAGAPTVDGRSAEAPPLGIEEGIATLSHIRTSRDGTTKLLVKLSSDGLEVETVIIPWDDRGRSTLCISSQVGCRQGCTFCATGRMGRLRSLTSDEILAQVYFSRKVCRVLNVLPVDGVVFMGMGEPADNADAVIKAAEILTNQQLFGMAQIRVTISTVAPTPDAFRELGRAPAALAWSVHASRDELRRRLVPTTKFTMEELRDGYVDAMLSRPRKLRTSMLEVALIEGVNDDPTEADHLADFALRMMDDVPGMKLMVNLIPFNDIGHPTYRKPAMERVWAFQERLTSKGLFCFIRTTRGDDESAACGQLATKKKKEKGEEATIAA